MTAPNPVVNGERPAPAVAGAGRETTAAWSTTTKTSADPAYRTAWPEWMSWDDVTIETVPDLAAELASCSCDWCGWQDHPAAVRVHGPWLVANDVCRACVEGCVAYAVQYQREHGRVLVETAS